jgi:cysteinyl-tRNA synthetase
VNIHGGGNDLIFPHHENEIAQTESLTGKPFARYWVHNGMLQLAGEKMSKSIGNLITVDEFLSEHEADAFRMIVLNTHYRGPLAFNTTIINQAERALERIRAALRPAVSSLDLSPDAAGALAAKAADVVSGFETAMDDDFNTAGGLAQIFDLVRAINQARDAGIDAEELKSGQETLMKLAGILGLRLKDRGIKQKEAAVFIDLLVELRQQLRQSEQWDLADLVRGRLEEQGIIIEDNKDGTSWRSR